MKSFRTITMICVITVVIISAGKGYAHRPLLTEDAGVGDLGEIIVEASYEQTREKSAKEHAGIGVVNFGLGRAEIGIEIPYVKTEANQKGFSDLLFKAKFLIAGKDEKSGLFTIKGEALSTTGDEKKGLGNENWEYAGSAVISKAFGDFTFHMQGGYNYVKGGIKDENSYFGGFAIDYGITEKFNFSAEIFGSKSKLDKPLSAGGGFFYEFNKHAVVDILVHKGITVDARDWLFTTGITLKF